MLNTLKKYLESEKKDKNIFDIILYGSSTKEDAKARDVDLLVIFLSGTLRERLERIQEIKKKIKNTEKNIDIKQILLQELFSANFFARTGIFLEGMSIFKEKKFCETLGFQSFTLFLYSLKNLSHTQKVKFNYLLAGRNDMQGLIKELKGIRLVNGAIKIPISKANIFEEILQKNKILYTKKEILEPL